MINNPIRISEYFDNEFASRILNENDIVVAPIITNIPMSLRSRQFTSIDENDFDNSYSNETGHVDSETQAIIASIVVPSKCYEEMDFPHFIPFFSGGIGELTSEGYIKNIPQNLSDDKNMPNVVIECENMAFILTLTGREVYIPICINEGDFSCENMPTSRLNYDILPGYVCYRYGPGEKFHNMISVNQDVVSNNAGTTFNSPIDINEKIHFEKPVLVHKDKEKEPQPNSKKCPECHRFVIDKMCVDCNLVYGRRGWRQLGIYDG